MVKLRKIAPVVAGISALGCMVAQASPAAASSAHNVNCDGAQLCLWYSAGADSAIFRTDNEIVWSNFSYDYVQNAVPTWDHFTSGVGSDNAVRNDAHSGEDGIGNNGDLLYSLPDTRGVEWEIPQANVIYTLPSSMRNNEASYKSTGCSINYGGVEIC